jgi:hypothetical protein
LFEFLPQLGATFAARHFSAHQVRMWFQHDDKQHNSLIAIIFFAGEAVLVLNPGLRGL